MKTGIANKFVLDEKRGEVYTFLMELQDFSPETFNHSLDVANIALLIGQKAGLTKQELTNLYTAALIHDVGKLTLDKNLLHKPDCTPEDRLEIQLGHIRGTHKLLDKNFPMDIVNIAYHHHEKLNGSGYPQGLKGDELSKYDRILQVADVTSALMMKRAYKETFTPEKTMSILNDMVNKNELDNKYVKIARDNIVYKQNNEENQMVM